MPDPVTNHDISVPTNLIDMVMEYFTYDYEFAKPPRVTSMQNTIPLSTFNNFGEDVFFIADKGGYERVAYYVASQFLKTSRNFTVIDQGLKFNKAPVGMVYFTCEHTGEHYNCYVHGAYLSGIDSANMMIKCIKKGPCRLDIKPKRFSEGSICSLNRWSISDCCDKFVGSN